MSKRKKITIIGLPMTLVLAVIAVVVSLWLHQKSLAGDQSFLEPVLEIAYSDSVELDYETGNYIVYYKDRYDNQKHWVFEPASKINIQIEANVEYDEDTDIYTYTYRVVSDRTSQQNAWRFGVQYGTEVFNPSSPKGWLFCESAIHSDVAVWGDVNGAQNGIWPGSSQEGFSFQSKGVPGTVACYAQGYTDIPSFGYGDAPEDIRPNFFGNCVVGTTIGPQ